MDYIDLLINIAIILTIGFSFTFVFWVSHKFFRKIAKTEKETYDDYFKRLIPGIFGGIIMYTLLQINTIISASASYLSIVLNLMLIIMTTLFIMLIGLYFFRGFKN